MKDAAPLDPHRGRELPDPVAAAGAPDLVMPLVVAPGAGEDDVAVIVGPAIVPGNEMLERHRMITVEPVPTPVASVAVADDQAHELVGAAAIHNSDGASP